MLLAYFIPYGYLAMNGAGILGLFTHVGLLVLITIVSFLIQIAFIIIVKIRKTSADSDNV